MGKTANHRKRARKVRRYRLLCIVAVQFVAVVAAVVTLLWLGPDWWDFASVARVLKALAYDLR